MYEVGDDRLKGERVCVSRQQEWEHRSAMAGYLTNFRAYLESILASSPSTPIIACGSFAAMTYQSISFAIDFGHHRPTY
jgi:hypothetical protein